MGREKRNAPGASAGNAKDRYRKALRLQYDPKTTIPSHLVAKPAVPASKHHTYFELRDNKDKKKKLDFKGTTSRTPPPGFEFVPTGNPHLTAACKEISRDKDAMIFIVSAAKDIGSETTLAHQTHRIGYHFRQAIVEEAKTALHLMPEVEGPVNGAPEPIPTDQALYNRQADAVIRDLFPRIPHTDRQIIIEHSFNLSAKPKGDPPVGLSADITLARRVQLAVLAHIRHTHTRYDSLLKEANWHAARKAVETLCLDILVKWRGDEENGRDQLDEILQEVVVISDSEDDESGDDTDDSSAEESDDSVEILSPPPLRQLALQTPRTQPNSLGNAQLTSRRPIHGKSQDHARSTAIVPASTPAKKTQRGFKRYQAWQDAIKRNRADEHQVPSAPMSRSSSHGFQAFPGGRIPQQASSNHLQSNPGLRLAVPSHPGSAYLENIDTRPPQMEPAQPRPVPAVSANARGSQLGGYSRPRTPPDRDVSPRITERFSHLLVRSIEPTSPSQMQPAFVRTVPPRSPGAMVQPYMRTGGGNHSGPPSPRAVMFPDSHPLPSRRLFSDHYLPDADFPGGFIEVSHRHVSDRNRERTQPSPAVALNSSRSRAYEPDDNAEDRPAKRAFLGGPATARPRELFHMEDRGGFFERVPVHPDGSRSVPPDPGFIEIRRAAEQTIAVDRVVSYEEGRRLRREPGAEVYPLPEPSFPVAPSRHDRPVAQHMYPVTQLHPGHFGFTGHRQTIEPAPRVRRTPGLVSGTGEAIAAHPGSQYNRLPQESRPPGLITGFPRAPGQNHSFNRDLPRETDGSERPDSYVGRDGWPVFRHARESPIVLD